MEQTNILVRPVITEKSMDEASRGRFTFVVAKGATKGDVKKAVEQQFPVTVVSVHTLITKGKGARSGKRRIEVKLRPVKKAIVELLPGQRIDLFDTKESQSSKTTEGGKNEQKT